MTTTSSDHRLGQDTGFQQYARVAVTDRLVEDEVRVSDRPAPRVTTAAPNGTSPKTDHNGQDRPAKKRGAKRSGRPRNTPVIKPSVVHVPAHLLPLITDERSRSGRSNGQILIAAIEAGYEQLVQQHQDSATIGGRLFTSRIAKPQLPASQPLSPLNIRMYEHDYDVLDKLVAELGAGSRSRLATLALVHYLDGSS